jgi:endonuclease-3 related protein
MKTVCKALLRHFYIEEWWPMKRKFKPKEWEVWVGAVLTQNTNWNNVEKALDHLSEAGVKDAKSLLALPPTKLQYLTKPAGFCKQK